MKCPYCLSELVDEALACPCCTKDLYLFKPMMQQVADLEMQLAELPDREALVERVSQLEALLAGRMIDEADKDTQDVSGALKSLFLFLVLPLVLLLLGHGLITIVYDTKLLYLRLISIIVPVLFGYVLMSSHPHKLLPWFLMATVLAIASVFGMSYMTHLVDGTPVMPQNVFEWREFVEYGVSIAMSFLTGMVLGRAAFIKHHPMIKTVVGGAYAALVAKTGESDIDPAGAFKLMKLFNEHISTVTALGSTVLSVYTGLKGVIGS